MTKPTVTATDRLANVLDVVELGQRTGLLRVERGNGTMREEGEVYFAQGKPIYAAIAGLRGREALHLLAQWTGCYFAFDPQAARPIPNVSGVLPAVSSPSNGAFARSGPNGYYGQNGANGFGPNGRPGPRLQVPPPAYQPANQAGYQPTSQPGYQPGYAPATPNFGASGVYTPATGSFSSDPGLPWSVSGPNSASQPTSQPRAKWSDQWREWLSKRADDAATERADAEPDSAPRASCDAARSHKYLIASLRRATPQARHRCPRSHQRRDDLQSCALTSHGAAAGGWRAYGPGYLASLWEARRRCSATPP